jgi:hypothetical protein
MHIKETAPGDIHREMQPDSDPDQLRVAEWLERYNDTGIVPVLIMLACTAVAALVFWVRVAPTADKHAKDMFFIVVGTPLLVTSLKLMMETNFPPTDTPETYTIPTFIMCSAEAVDWVLNWPVTSLVGEENAFALQIVLFTFGICWFNVTKLFKVMDLPDTSDTEFSKTNIIFLALVAFFLMSMAVWVWKPIFVFAKCMGIYECCRQIKEIRDWLHSTERTSGKKKEVLSITNSTDPEKLWNKIAEKPGMEDKTYDQITNGCRNKPARQNALLPHLEKYFVVKDDR